MIGQLDLFISYNFEDIAFVGEVAQRLDERGITSWFAQSRVRAGHWRTEVEEAIDAASAFILIVSPAMGSSSEVENEFRRAEAAHCPILAVYGSDCRPPLYANSVHAGYYYREPDHTLDLIAELVREATRQRRSAETSYLARCRRRIADDIGRYSQLKYKRISESMSTLPDLQELVNAAVASYEDPTEQSTSPGVGVLSGVLEHDQPEGPIRALLVGESGAGKTTTLLKLFDELGRKVQDDPNAPIPLFVSLRNYTGTRSFEDYIRTSCARELGDLVNHLGELLASGRLALLIDGFNEIPRIAGGQPLREMKAFLARRPDLFVVVACKTIDYTPEHDLGLDTVIVRPLNPLQIRTFIGQMVEDPVHANAIFWSLIDEGQAQGFHDEFLRLGGSEAAFWLHQGQRPPLPVDIERPFYHWKLWLDVRDDPLRLLAVAKNPYMLTLIVQVYLAKGSLPRNQYELFSVFFEVLCEAVHERRQRAGGYWLTCELQAPLFVKLSQEMHERGKVSLTRPDVLQMVLAEVADIDATQFLALAEEERVLDCGDEVTFSHQLLREFFAAAVLETAWRNGDDAVRFLDQAAWWTPNGWEEAVVFLAGKYVSDPAPLLNWLKDAQPELVSQCVVQSQCRLSAPDVDSLAAAWLPRLLDLNEPPQARAAVGRAVGRLNIDRRAGVTETDLDGLPLIQWVAVAGSIARIGGATSPATPVEPFDISRYLVTNAQYQPFIDDGGYTERHRDCWTRTGWDWRSIAERRSPDDYTEVFRLPNHPRIGTVWYEGHAYCEWLTRRWRHRGELSADQEIRLPTEQEWEAASRGATGKRLYPWGDDFSYEYCNVRDIRSTTAVGVYPNGTSPEGVWDLVGNAWSWCRTRWHDDPAVQDNDPEGDDPRVYRGGSWAYDFNISRWKPEELSCERRYWIIPLDDRPDAIGFFVVRGRRSSHELGQA